METVKIIDAMKREDMIRVIDEIIVYARYLNKDGAKSLPGTEFLHGMLKNKVITNELYQQLVKLAEDPSLEYEIVI